MAARWRGLAEMAVRFVPIDHATRLLFPPDLRGWVPADHLVHFLLDAVDGLDLRQVRVNTRGTGSEQYPPRMLLGLLLYSYATGTFGRRRLGQSTHDRVPVRPHTAVPHPDHATLRAFRREHRALLNESFVQVWPLAQQLQVLKPRAAHRRRRRHQGARPRQQTQRRELPRAGEQPRLEERKQAAEGKRKAAEERAKPREVTVLVWSQPFVVKVTPAPAEQP